MIEKPPITMTEYTRRELGLSIETMDARGFVRSTGNWDGWHQKIGATDELEKRTTDR